MNKTILTAIALISIFMIVTGYPRSDSPLPPPGVLAPDDPYQETVDDLRKWKKESFVVTPLAEFEIEARVLSSANYWFGEEAKLSPVDLALGWGPMSDTEVLEKINIKQARRRYKWYTESFPIPRQDISSHSANMHMVPADKKVEKALKSIRKNDLVYIYGYLVRFDRPDGWHWVSSLTRDDTGDGACEVIWVEEIEKL